MRLFLIGWGDDVPELVDVAEELTRRSHQIVYWVRSSITMKIDQSRFPGTIFQELDEALALKSAPGLDTSEILPPEEQLLAKLCETELIILTMMNKKYEGMNVLERKHFYYQLVRYWHGVMRQYQPEAILFPVVPHTVYDFVIYALAKQMNIKTIMFDLTRVTDGRMLCLNDFKQGSRELVEELRSNRDKNFSIEDLAADIKEYYLKQTLADGAIDRMPLDVVGLLRDYGGWNNLWLKFKIVKKGIRDGTIFNKITIFLMNRFKSNLRKEYGQAQTVPDLSKKFVYVPLNYQPERTTSPQGGVYADQLLMVETLSAALPSGWRIYVKEHPFQWSPRGPTYFSYRYKGYYESIARLPRVQVVPLSVSNYVLVEQAQAVATVTGTAGWEGLLRGKPALVFGYPWYQNCPGIFRVDSVNACRQALIAVSRSGAVDQSKIINYLVCFGKASVRGYVDVYGRQLSTVSKEENKQNLLLSLVREVED